MPLRGQLVSFPAPVVNCGAFSFYSNQHLNNQRISPHGEGYVKVYRKLLTSAVFEQEGLLKVWVWCLLRANWTETSTLFEGKELPLHKGEFLTGRFTGSKECRMRPRTFHSRLQKLSELGQIRLKSDNKKTLVSIVNYTSYQNVLDTIGQQDDNRMTTRGQQNDTDKEVKKLRREETATEAVATVLLVNGNGEDFDAFLLQQWGREGRMGAALMEGFRLLAKTHGWERVRYAVSEAANHGAKSIAYVKGVLEPKSSKEKFDKELERLAKEKGFK